MPAALYPMMESLAVEVAAHKHHRSQESLVVEVAAQKHHRSQESLVVAVVDNRLPLCASVVGWHHEITWLFQASAGMRSWKSWETHSLNFVATIHLSLEMDW